MTTEPMTTDSPENSAEVGTDVQRLVRRFDPFYRCDQGCKMTADMEEDTDGDWVAYDDVWQPMHSARYILEDADPEKLADACGLPLGVIVAALENILQND